MPYYVYILASKKNGVLYTGVTNNLFRRTGEHKSGLNDGFTRKYHVYKLVYFEQYSNINAAILREKQIKKWNRQWKINRIEETNPEWNDLAEPLPCNCHVNSAPSEREPTSATDR